MPRTAGTRTMIDALLGRFGRTRTPEDDLADLESGESLRVVVYVPRGKRSAWHGGMATLHRDHLKGPILRAVGPAPRRVTAVTEVEGKFPDSAQFRELRGTGPDGEWRVAVPEVDVPVVRRAIDSTAGADAG
ncbi:hypothetical protein [Luteimicrobium subarcticum]|uniref:Uncharacterized protein n=1 Tax=Luteimicrobium subarcticum TaxID=620910 RepID=A0A2M8WWC9_9MICO|nr:hypothetical protein [Luteimicrobium subarcticum]PJI95232.1 hypothetical protein CLV34_0107 [Luteimicrobium subarcticum]